MPFLAKKISSNQGCEKYTGIALRDISCHMIFLPLKWGCEKHVFIYCSCFYFLGISFCYIRGRHQ